MIKIEKIVNWDYIVTEAISQKNEWIILDLKDTMQNLRKTTLIKEEYFQKLYKNI